MRLALATVWILIGSALTAGVYWIFLITPESTVWSLLASARWRSPRCCGRLHRERHDRDVVVRAIGRRHAPSAAGDCRRRFQPPPSC